MKSPTRDWMNERFLKCPASSDNGQRKKMKKKRSDQWSMKMETTPLLCVPIDDKTNKTRRTSRRTDDWTPYQCLTLFIMLVSKKRMRKNNIKNYTSQTFLHTVYPKSSGHNRPVLNSDKKVTVSFNFVNHSLTTLLIPYNLHKLLHTNTWTTTLNICTLFIALIQLRQPFQSCFAVNFHS